MIAGMNLKQLAKHLNLSQTTVSRALNGYPEVNAETRRRVDEVARKVGYRPNPHAMRLATGRSHAIGHVLPSDRTAAARSAISPTSSRVPVMSTVPMVLM